MNSYISDFALIFKRRFSDEPSVYYAPGRINLIGEHIDYNDGYVMPAAIDKGIYYLVSLNNTDTINFYAADMNESLSVKTKEIKKSAGWKNYVLSVLNEFILSGKEIGGFNCVFGGNIPLGSGMSSSAAVETGLAFALNDLFGWGMNLLELALLCQRAEHNFPEVNCGIMDMYASLNGKKDHVIFLDCKSITHTYFPLKLNSYKIVLINTKVHHSLAAGEYNIRRKNCEAGLAILKNKLNIASWRDVDEVAQIEILKHMLATDVYNCCRFVIEEIVRTQKAGTFLQQNRTEDFGQLMFDTHWGLSNLYNVSCPQSDFLVSLASTNKNVLGARQMGGGFGGCTINIIKEEAIDEFIKQVIKEYTSQYKIEPEIYITAISNGVQRIS